MIFQFLILIDWLCILIFLMGHIHIQVATQNVNLTLYFLPTLSPLITSSVTIEKYLPNKPLNVTDYWEFIVSNHGSCFRRAGPCFLDFPDFHMLEIFRNRTCLKKNYLAPKVSIVKFEKLMHIFFWNIRNIFAGGLMRPGRKN